jgi:hypothetical protein
MTPPAVSNVKRRAAVWYDEHNCANPSSKADAIAKAIERLPARQFCIPEHRKWDYGCHEGNGGLFGQSASLRDQ